MGRYKRERGVEQKAKVIGQRVIAACAAAYLSGRGGWSEIPAIEFSGQNCQNGCGCAFDDLLVIVCLHVFIGDVEGNNLFDVVAHSDEELFHGARISLTGADNRGLRITPKVDLVRTGFDQFSASRGMIAAPSAEFIDQNVSCWVAEVIPMMSQD